MSSAMLSVSVNYWLIRANSECIDFALLNRSAGHYDNFLEPLPLIDLASRRLREPKLAYNFAVLTLRCIVNNVGINHNFTVYGYRYRYHRQNRTVSCSTDSAAQALLRSERMSLMTTTIGSRVWC